MSPEFRIVPASRENIHGIPDLVFSVYGHTYESPWMYDPAQILSRIEARERHLFLALDDQDRVRGCLGMEFPFSTRAVGFFCSFLVDPAVRGLASGFIFKDLAEAVHACSGRLAREEGLRAILSSETVMHTLSQRYITAYGFRDCGVFLAWCPAWASRQRPGQFGSTVPRTSPAAAGETFRDRRAEIVSARVFPDLIPPYRVRFPAPFAGLLREIYEALGLPAAEGGPIPGPDPETVLQESVDPLRSLAVLDVLRAGADAASRILERSAHHGHGMADLVHVRIPLCRGDAGPIVEPLLADGFRFCAVLPALAQGDVLVLQRLNGVTSRVTESAIHADLGRRILRAATAGIPERPTIPAP